MCIGIGVTTYNRPECLAKWKEQIDKHIDWEIKNSNDYKLYGYDKSGNPITIYIADDSIERKGIAYRKNECLRALKDCDYIFLFDDDCYPIKDNWIDFFVNSGEKHLLFMNDKLHNVWGNYLRKHDAYVLIFKDCGGAFMFFTKEIIEKHGYMDESFGIYGFEHAEYSSRILGKHGQYPMLSGTENYIYAEDYSNPKHKSSISLQEKNKWIKKNWNKFLTFANK